VSRIVTAQRDDDDGGVKAQYIRLHALQAVRHPIAADTGIDDPVLEVMCLQPALQPGGVGLFKRCPRSSRETVTQADNGGLSRIRHIGLDRRALSLKHAVRDENRGKHDEDATDGYQSFHACGPCIPFYDSALHRWGGGKQFSFIGT
jgi:hypothetical protein